MVRGRPPLRSVRLRQGGTRHCLQKQLWLFQGLRFRYLLSARRSKLILWGTSIQEQIAWSEGLHKEKYERPPLTKTATNFITPNQKENINLQAVHQTLDSMASSQQFQKSKTVKLNKNSKNFEKSPLTDDQTTIESDSGKITISVIKVTDDFRSRSEEALSNQSSRSEKNHCMKPVSEKPGISRLSKEFYPSRPLTFSPPSTIDELSPSGGYFQPMTNPFLVFHPSYSQSENEVSNTEAPRLSRPRTLSRNSFKISFFTFPGRD